MKWEDVTRQQLTRMEADEMNEKKSINWSYWLDWAAALIVVATFVIGVALYIHMRNTAPCSFWANHPASSVPARCLAEWMAHG